VALNIHMVGNCAISIVVSGENHNGKRTDIDQMAADFIEHLKAKGHTVIAAHLVSGVEFDLLKPESRYGLAGEGR
jgi:hypothetical protein